MSGNGAYAMLGYPSHYYPNVNECHVATPIVIAEDYTATLRIMDQVDGNGNPTMVDIPNIPYDYLLSSAGTWHAGIGCGNTGGRVF